MAGFKMGRLTEDMKRELSALIRELKDPRIDPMLSVVKVQLANDLSHCKVYVSTIQGMEQTKTSVKGLISASGYLKRQMGQRLHLRKVPELTFIADDAIAYGSHIIQMMEELEQKEGENHDSSL